MKKDTRGHRSWIRRYIKTFGQPKHLAEMAYAAPEVKRLVEVIMNDVEIALKEKNQ
ncbi:MAG: hypothetical protein WKF87_22540 [Chryseolinea sp.]